MKTEYKSSGFDVYLPDEWEFSYKDDMIRFTERYSDYIPDDAFFGMVNLTALFFPDADIEISGKSLSVSMRASLEYANVIMASEFLMKLFATYGQERYKQFIDNYSPLLEQSLKKDENKS